MAKIEGLLTLTSPLHINVPGKSYFDWETGRFCGDNGSATPCKRVTTMNLVQDSDEDGVPQNCVVPIIPANSLRGRLRRKAADIVFNHFLSKGERLTLAAYHVLSSGSSSGSPDKDLPTVQEVRACAEHPFLGLFGGGPRMMRSSFRVDTGFLVSPETCEAGIVPPAFQKRKADLRRSRQVFMFRKIDDALAFSNPLTGEIVKDYHQSMDEWMDAREEAKNARKAKKEAKGNESKGNKKPSKLDVWSSFETVVPGSPFFVRFENTGIHDMHTGLLLLSLEALFNDQNLGGWVRNGFGRYTVKDMVLTEGGSTHKLFVEGDGKISLDRSNTKIQAILAEFEEALESINAGELEELCQSKG